MLSTRSLLRLPPARFWYLPSFFLFVIGTILSLAQSPLPAALTLLFILLAIALLFRYIPDQPLSRSRTSSYWLLTALFCLALPYLIETSLRLSDTSRHQPPDGLVNGTLYTWGHVITNNSYGFREREFTVPKPTGTYRLMVLGDSMSWGVGVPVNDRYSNLLENILNETASSQHFEVLNFAAQAANIADELATLQKYIDVAEPDQIVIGFNFDDIDSADNIVDPENRRLATEYNRLIDPYFTKLRLYYLSGQTVKAIKQAATLAGYIPDQTVEVQRQLASQKTNLYSFENTLQQIKAISDTHHLPPPILIILERGLYTDRPTNYAHPEPALQAIIDQQILAEKTAQSVGFITQHHREDIAYQLNDQILSVNAVDHHPSVALHRLYAAKLRDTVLANMSYAK
ncbi:MAG: hypothetical protein WC734_06440 [Patescibacteria group bacterium]|jgi:hypothetical protein